MKMIISATQESCEFICRDDAILFDKDSSFIFFICPYFSELLVIFRDEMVFLELSRGFHYTILRHLIKYISFIICFFLYKCCSGIGVLICFAETLFEHVIRFLENIIRTSPSFNHLFELCSKDKNNNQVDY